MTDPQIRTTPIPAAIAEAWQFLAAAVADDLWSDIALTKAADALVDVYPPYPPAAAAPVTLPQSEAVRGARAALARAAAAAGGIEERLRVAAVVHMLRDLDGRT